MSLTDLIPWKKREKGNVPVKMEERQYPTRTLQRDLNAMFDAMRDQFFREVGLGPFDATWNAVSPRVDIVERDEEVEVSVELPGVDRKEIDVTITDDALTISGEKREEHEDHGRGYYRMERAYGAFRRTVPLPVGVDGTKAEATYRKGVLTITLPKIEDARTIQRIPIKTS